MGGGESKKRAEEKREAASAKRPEIREKELKEERLALIRLLFSVGVRTSIISSSSLTMWESEEEEEKEEEEVKTHLCEEDERQRAGSPVPSCLSLKSDRSIGEPPVFSNEPGPSDTKDPGINAATDLDSIFWILDMFGFVKNELKRLKRLLTNDPEGLESQGEYEEGLNVKEEAQRRGSREGFLKITLDFLRRMNQEELADALQDKALAAVGHRKPKSKLKNMIGCVSGGIARVMRSGPMFK